jgi:hypothetical protein
MCKRSLAVATKKKKKGRGPFGAIPLLNQGNVSRLKTGHYIKNSTTNPAERSLRKLKAIESDSKFIS